MADGAQNVVDRKDELAKEMQDRTQAILPKIEQSAKESAERLIPIMKDKFAKAQAKAQSELPDALDKASKSMSAHLDLHMKQTMDKELDSVIVRQRTRLEDTFPEQLKCSPADPPDKCKKKKAEADRLMGEIKHAYQDWAIHELRTTFDGHLKSMDDIRQTMAGFGAKAPAANAAGPAGAAPPSAPSAADTPRNLLEMWLELVTETIAGPSDTFDENEKSGTGALPADGTAPIKPPAGTEAPKAAEPEKKADAKADDKKGDAKPAPAKPEDKPAAPAGDKK